MSYTVERKPQPALAMVIVGIVLAFSLAATREVYRILTTPAPVRPPVYVLVPVPIPIDRVQTVREVEWKYAKSCPVASRTSSTYSTVGGGGGGAAVWTMAGGGAGGGGAGGAVGTATASVASVLAGDVQRGKVLSAGDIRPDTQLYLPATLKCKSGEEFKLGYGTP